MSGNSEPVLSLREALRQGRSMLGLAACVLRGPEIVLVTRSAGFDWLLIDTEHAPIDLAEASRMAVAAQLAGLPALIRTLGPDVPDLARMLDIGAEGLVVPHVDSAAQARRVVEACRFPPHGRRSVPGPLPSFGFDMPPVPEMMSRAEARTSLVAMVESAAGLSEIEAIAAVPGIDAVMIGANDLAADLGRPGALEHPDVHAAFTRIARATQSAGKVFGVIGLPEALLASHGVSLGARLILAANDINLLLDGATSLSGRLRRLATVTPDHSP